MNENEYNRQPDIILIGAGIMSATLGLMLKELEPGLTIDVFERLDGIAHESTDAWNNAGTGHSAFCELNYTPMFPDGSIDIKKAIQIAASYEVSKEFWAYLVKQNYLGEPGSFINDIPHMTFVRGDESVAYLKKRHQALTGHHLFEGMKYAEDHTILKEWMPLIMEGRDPKDKVAATKMDIGTDVNFGSLTRCMFKHLSSLPGVSVHLNHEVKRIDKGEGSKWELEIKDLESKDRHRFETKFVFIGAGGGSLSLLEESGIPEGKGFGGFPISGQWLICKNEEVIKQHDAKVYGKANVGAPPMSVPHLDTRIINGKKALLFGPYAGFSTKFLKYGSLFDLPASIKLNNIRPMLSAGVRNMKLTRYLIDQVTQSPEDRMEALRYFIPTAKIEDWKLEIAGQRVQVIKKDPDVGGVLQFGTELVTSADGSIAALLGASPGASVSVSIMLDLIKNCFTDKSASIQWNEKLKEMIPSYGESLENDSALLKRIRTMTSEVLKLK